MTSWVLFFIVVCTQCTGIHSALGTYMLLCASLFWVQDFYPGSCQGTEGTDWKKERNLRNLREGVYEWMLWCIRGKLKKVIFLSFKKVLGKKKIRAQTLPQFSHFTFQKLHDQKSLALHTITEKRRAGSQQTAWQFYVTSAPKILFSKTCLTATCFVCYFRHFDT